MKGCQDRVNFDSAFWANYDTHVAPIVRRHKNIDAPHHPEVSPEDLRKKQEEEKEEQEDDEMFTAFGCSTAGSPALYV